MSSNIASVVKGLDEVAKRQIPFAAASALTQTAKAVEKRLQREMRSVFDNPSPFVARGTFVQSAKKTALEALVGMKDRNSGRGASPAQYVRESFLGGARGQKPFEVALRGQGVLPNGWKAMPGAGMKLDRFGAPDRRQLAEIIGSMKAGMHAYKGRGKRMQLVGYFAVRPGDRRAAARHLKPGIYRRASGGRAIALQPVFVFVRQAAYQQRIDLPQLGAQVVRAEFDGLFRSALEGALRSAR